MRCAIYDKASGDVLNIVLADPASYDPGQGRAIRASDAAAPGWRWDGAQFVDTRPVEPPPLPVQVERWKARVVMKATPWAGTYGGPGKTVFDAVQAAIAALPAAQQARAQEAFGAASYLTRNGTIVRGLQQAIGMSDAQADDLFRQAEAVQA
jgi:hypothetical protein